MKLRSEFNASYKMEFTQNLGCEMKIIPSSLKNYLPLQLLSLVPVKLGVNSCNES